VIKRTRNRTGRPKKAAAAKRSGVKAPLRFPKQRSVSTAPASGPARPPKPPDHHKFAPWADKPPTDKVRKFADEIFGDFELTSSKRKH
jgi:hypothetical protein